MAEVAMEFDPLSADFFDDPYDTYRWLRDEAPVYYSEHYGFWALSRYEDVVVAHRDWQTFTSTKGITLDQLAEKDIGSLVVGSIIFMDPPDHERLRRLVSRVFTPNAVAELEPLVRTLVTKYLDPLVGESSFDLTADFAGPFPVEVISAILGVPEPDRQQIRHWTDEMLHREPGDPKPTQAGMEAGL
ncbi:MAG: cytochrome P450, partial [Acidimicrobiia bacterium]